MKKRCPNCRLINYADAENCIRCDLRLSAASVEVAGVPVRRPRLAVRAVVCVAVCVAILLVFYISLIATSKRLGHEQRSRLNSAISVIKERGFEKEARFLEHIAVYRGSDNWFNAMIPKENAFAATNFPFEIMTLYPDFFTYPVDDVERAAILLHESRHLLGDDEPEAYRFVWKNRQKLGWTRDAYLSSVVWLNVRRQTREQAPELFACPGNDAGDCTEWSLPNS